MTEKEINIEIAKACGWKNCSIEFAGGIPSGRKLPNGLERDLPDYCHDLNSMHEAELTVMGDSRWFIWMQAKTDVAGVHATAMQRAEAFLRVKGLWK